MGLVFVTVNYCAEINLETVKYGTIPLPTHILELLTFNGGNASVPCHGCVFSPLACRTEGLSTS